MLGKKCSLTPLKEELRKQGVSGTKAKHTNTSSAINKYYERPQFLISVCTCRNMPLFAGFDNIVLKQSEPPISNQLMMLEESVTVRGAITDQLFPICQLSSVTKEP